SRAGSVRPAAKSVIVRGRSGSVRFADMVGIPWSGDRASPLTSGDTALARGPYRKMWGPSAVMGRIGRMGPMGQGRIRPIGPIRPILGLTPLPQRHRRPQVDRAVAAARRDPLAVARVPHRVDRA